MKLTFEEFYIYYQKKGYFPLIFGKQEPNKTEQQVIKFYEKYKKLYEKNLIKLEKDKQKNLLKKQEKPIFTIDEEMEELKSQMWQRDKSQCQMWIRLTKEEKLIVGYSNIIYNSMYKQLDTAHIFEKSVYPKLKYCLNNVVLLSRYFHSLLDGYKHPITEYKITKEDRIKIFLKLLPDNRKEELQKDIYEVGYKIDLKEFL